MNRDSLVPVGNDPGALNFKYNVVEYNPFVHATTLELNPNNVKPKNVPTRVEGQETDDLPDFLGFEPPVATTTATDSVPQNVINLEGDDANAACLPDPIKQTFCFNKSLLDDYTSLGMIPPPAQPQSQSNNNDNISLPPPMSAVPWLSSLSRIQSPMLRLHQEIVELSRYLAPTHAEASARSTAVARIQSIVQAIWPQATLEVFGSFATGLYLPTSDIDAVILNSQCEDVAAGLKALANALSRKNLAKNMTLITKARVPIVKFEEAESGYSFDISFDVANGPEAAANVRRLMDTLPPMRALVTVIKVFLQQRELNEVYSGGLGSYAVLVMVAAFLQLHKNKSESNLGILLVDFFRLYGRNLSHMNVGVSCRRGGLYFNKRSKGFFAEERPYLYAIEDPNDPTNDLGKNSYNATRARTAFEYAYYRLTASSTPGESLLQRIVRLDPVLFAREPSTTAAATAVGGWGGGVESHRPVKKILNKKRKKDEEADVEVVEEEKKDDDDVIMLLDSDTENSDDEDVVVTVVRKNKRQKQKVGGGGGGGSKNIKQRQQRGAKKSNDDGSNGQKKNTKGVKRGGGGGWKRGPRAGDGSKRKPSHIRFTE